MSLFDCNWRTQVDRILPPVLRDGDYINDGGDFKYGDADNQAIHYLIVSGPGHWKEFPTIGVGIHKYLQGTRGPQEIQREIRKHLENDIFPNPLVDARSFPTITVNRIQIQLE